MKLGNNFTCVLSNFQYIYQQYLFENLQKLLLSLKKLTRCVLLCFHCFSELPNAVLSGLSPSGWCTCSSVFDNFNMMGDRLRSQSWSVPSCLHTQAKDPLEYFLLLLRTNCLRVFLKDIFITPRVLKNPHPVNCAHSRI